MKSVESMYLFDVEEAVMPAFRLPKAKCEKVVKPKRDFAKDFGFRWVKSGSSYIMVGCPKGKTKTQAKGCKKTRTGKRICGRKVICTVGTKAHTIVTAAKKGKRCPTGAKRVGIMGPMTLKQARALIAQVGKARGPGVVRGRF